MNGIEDFGRRFAKKQFSKDFAGGVPTLIINTFKPEQNKTIKENLKSQLVKM